MPIEFNDPFSEMIPFMLSSERPTAEEPRFDELHGKRTRTRYVELMRKRNALAMQGGRVAVGSAVVVFHSNIGEKEAVIEKDGVEKTVSNYFHSGREGEEHKSAAEGLARNIASMTVGQVEVDVSLVTREALDEALLDNGVGHILYVGHANRSQLTIDPIYTYNWHEQPPEMDHLKRSFGVFGCGTHKGDRFYPRIGSTFVHPEGILYGVPGGYLDSGQPYSFDQLVSLPLEPLEGVDLGR